MDNDIEDHWEQHKKAAYPNGMSALEEVQAKMSFYAGVQCNVTTLTNLIKGGAAEATFLTKLHANGLECNNYINGNIKEFVRVHLTGKR